MTVPVQIDIRSRKTESAYIPAPFDIGKIELENLGYKIISLEQTAQLRINEGAYHYVSRYGNWTREGIINIPNKAVFLTKKSPIMANVVEAIDSQRNGEDYFLRKEKIEEALSDSIELPNPRIIIPVNRFGDDVTTVFAFGNVARKYGEFLADAGIEEMPISWFDAPPITSYFARQDKLFARQVWFEGLMGYSHIRGSASVNDVDRVRGIKESKRSYPDRWLQTLRARNLLKILKM